MLNKDSIALTVLFGALVAIPPLSTDVGLPAYDATAQSFHVAAASIALTLSFFMIGFSTGPLFIGPASEKYGRKPVLLAGLAVYLLASLVCTGTPSFWLLLVGRIVQGVAASAGTVLSVACIRDLYDGITGRRKLSTVMMINGVMPLLGPTIGVGILALSGWRSIYGLMVVAGLFLILGVRYGLAETISRRNPQALAPRQLLCSYREVAMHPISMRAILIKAFGFGATFAYISGSPILFIGEMHRSAEAFGLIFASTGISIVCGTYASTQMQHWGVKTTTVVKIGLSATVAATLGLFVLCALQDYFVLPLVALVCLSNFGIGMSGPNAAYSAVQYMPHLAGPASALLSSIQMMIAAISSALMSILFAVLGPAAMAAVMFGFAILAGAVFLSSPTAPPNPHRTS